MSPGYLERVRGAEVHGWATVAPGECHAAMELRIDGQPVATVTARIPRIDLQEAGIAGYGFRILIPQRFFDGKAHLIDIVHLGEGAPLSGSPRLELLAGPVPQMHAPAVAAAAAPAAPALEPLAPRRPPAGLLDMGRSARKNGGRVIIAYPIIPWNFRWQRPQQILSRLAKAGFTILYLAQTLEPADRIFADAEEAAGDIRVERLAADVFCLWLNSASAFNIYRDAMAGGDLHNALEGLSAALEVADPFHLIHLVQLPSWYPLVAAARLRHGGEVVYDCMDHHAGFSTNTAAALNSESELIGRADLILASSLQLHRELLAKNAGTILVKNGCEFAHFHDPVPNGKLDHLTHAPIIGYFGAIADWFDIALVERLATERPSWNFVLIGATDFCNIARAAALPNVHFLGEKPYAELPGYLAYFDVCMIPFLITPLTEATNPVKFYEYMSAGKPVVATRLPELLPYAEHVRFAENGSAFIVALEESLRDASAAADKHCRLAAANDWTERVARILAHPVFGRAARPSSVPGRVSIVVLTYNGLDALTRPCLESVLANSGDIADWELIVVDNASEDGVPDYLAALARTHPHVRIKLNSENKGYARGNNDGMRMATGEYIVLLNNDTRVPPGWLPRLLEPFRLSDTVGMVGPVTNSAGNEQTISLPPGPPEELEAAGVRYAERHQQALFLVDRLGFFCVAVRRTVIDRIGLLDPSFGIGMFEDDDYCLRAAACGFQLAVTEGCFVYHAGSASMSRLSGARYRQLFETNRALFERIHRRHWTFTDIALSYHRKFRQELALIASQPAEREHALERLQLRMAGFEGLLQHLRNLEAAARPAIAGADPVSPPTELAPELLEMLGDLRRRVGSTRVVIFGPVHLAGAQAGAARGLARAFARHGRIAILAALAAEDEQPLWQFEEDGVVILRDDAFAHLAHAFLPEEAAFVCLDALHWRLRHAVPHSATIYLAGKSAALDPAAHAEALAQADVVLAGRRLAEGFGSDLGHRLVILDDVALALLERAPAGPWPAESAAHLDASFELILRRLTPARPAADHKPSAVHAQPA